MDLLDYLKIAQEYSLKNKTRKYSSKINISILTNFTDDFLQKILSGMCLKIDVEPIIYKPSFKQYLFELKDAKSKLWRKETDVTFIFFDINTYISSEFSSGTEYIEEIIKDIIKYSQKTKGVVVIQTSSVPSSTQHTRILKDHSIKRIAEEYNEKIRKLPIEFSNVYIVETDNIVRELGEKNVRDMRGLYAFSIPFSNDFLGRIAREWLAFIKTIKGKVYKCIVLDLDNTLWGGVLGETGPTKIVLGHEYPGNAFLEFQKILLNYYDRGIILAINSRNNPDDVYEVFEKNKHMILKKHHFAAIFSNWNNKAENLRLISKDLNIGLDSMVFIDDDAMNRDLVKQELPEVLVPDWSIRPEESIRSLLEIDAFHTLKLTMEDREKGKMYAVERERKEILTESSNLGDYIKTLEVEIDFYENNLDQITRLAQLTQKTNQFNLTTIRLTENEVKRYMKNNLVFSGDVKDKFGPYGITVLAFVKINKKEAALENFLMSCRVMGRNVEKIFMNTIIERLEKIGVSKIKVNFIPTKKNLPSSNFLPSIGAKEIKKSKKIHSYEINTRDYIKKTKEKIPIKVNTIK